MKNLFILFSILLPAVVYCQTTTFISSHPTIVSVKANGAAKLETTNTNDIQFVTITTATTQNGKTLTSTKQIEVNSYYPACNEPSVYIAGLWWAGCNVGASTAIDSGKSWGTQYGYLPNDCALGWRIPTIGETSNLFNSSKLKEVIKSDTNGYSFYFNVECCNNGSLGLYHYGDEVYEISRYNSNSWCLQYSSSWQYKGYLRCVKN